METIGPAPPISRPPTGHRVGPKAWGLKDAGAGIVIAFVALIVIGSIVFGIAFAITGETEGTSITAANIIGTSIFDAALVGIAFFFVVHRRRLSWSALGFGTSPLKWWWVPPTAAISALVAVGLYAFAMRELGADALAPDQEIDDLFETTALLPIVGIFTVFVAPITEETFFRGFIFPALITRFRVWGALLLAGALFGVAHITSVDTIGLIIPIGAIGGFFCWIYYRTGSLWPSIGTHLLFNTVGFVAGVLEAA